MERSIDLVIPMVFPLDPVWQRDYTRYAYGNAAGNVRYRSWETEELQVRCCLRFMPWVRTVHILLASPSQVRPWMSALAASCAADGPRIRLVFHGEFIRRDKLPTFNSATIEAFLGSIPGLADRFVYSNDDMFPLSPLSQEDFFRDGLPCYRFTEKDYPARPNIWHGACLSGLNFVASEFGRTYKDRWVTVSHSMTPILRSTCEHLWQRDAGAMLSSCTRTRRSHNFYQYIYPLYHYFTGRYSEGTCPYRYVSTRQTVAQMREVLRTSPGVVCVNDNECVADVAPYAAAVREEVRRRLAAHLPLTGG